MEICTDKILSLICLLKMDYSSNLTLKASTSRRCNIAMRKLISQNQSTIVHISYLPHKNSTNLHYQKRNTILVNLMTWFLSLNVLIVRPFFFYFYISMSQMTSGYVPLVVSTSWSFPHSWLITGFVTGLTRRMPIVEQELLTLPRSTWVHPRFLASFVLLDL